MDVGYRNDGMGNINGVEHYIIGPFAEYQAHHSYYDTYPILGLVFPPSVERIAQLIDEQTHWFGEEFTLSIPVMNSVPHGKLYFHLTRVDHKNKKVVITVEGTLVQGKLEGNYSINIVYDFETIIKLVATFVNGLAHGIMRYINEAVVVIANYSHGAISNYKFEYVWRYDVIPDFDLDLSQIHIDNLFVYGDLLSFHRYFEVRGNKQFVYTTDVPTVKSLNDCYYDEIIDTISIPEFGDKFYKRIITKVHNKHVISYTFREEIFNNYTQEVYTKHLYREPGEITSEPSFSSSVGVGVGSYNGLYQKFGLSPTMTISLLPVKGEISRQFWDGDEQYYVKYSRNGNIEYINHGQIGKKTITTYFDERGNPV